jgi:stress response protein YsnF
MHRFKCLGERLQVRKPAQQAAEVYVRCAILNRLTHLGMPVTVPCA